MRLKIVNNSDNSKDVPIWSYIVRMLILYQPINYLIKIRLEKAKTILERGEGGSIKNIANEVGYEDVYHFSKLFKKYYGVSPLNYKKGHEAQLQP